MTEHRHEWRYTEAIEHDFDDTGPVAITTWTFSCSCGETLGDQHGPIGEIERRLNATEALSAEGAERAERTLSAYLGGPTESGAALVSYAAILRGNR